MPRRLGSWRPTLSQRTRKGVFDDTDLVHLTASDGLELLADRVLARKADSGGFFADKCDAVFLSTTVVDPILEWIPERLLPFCGCFRGLKRLRKKADFRTESTKNIFPRLKPC